MKRRYLGSVLFVLSLTACGGSPPPVEQPAQEAPRPSRPSGPKLQMQQELGSIDQRKVEQTFSSLVRGPLETCHKKGRDRVDVLTGDVKIFLRIDGEGRVKYGLFEDSTMGDRETEKCIMDVLRGAAWPKPEGGEAEVRSGFGWGPGDEREPTSWPSDKVSTALVLDKDVMKDVHQCKAGVAGDFRVTAYVEAGEPEHKPEPAAKAPDGKNKPGQKPKDAKRDPKHDKRPEKTDDAAKEKGGRFKAIGVTAPSKEAAEKIDCLVDALKSLDLPSPGSYPAKVTFSL